MALECPDLNGTRIDLAIVVQGPNPKSRAMKMSSKSSTF
jgi:hypothetical protein